LTLFLALAVFGAEAADRVRRNVLIEWEKIDGASAYEVQVVRKDDSMKKPLRFKTKEPKWSATIKPGLYNMQIRSYDDRGVPGDWSPPSELTVKLPAIIALAPSANEVVNASAEKSDEVRFKWEPVSGAIKYRIHAQSASGAWTADKDVDTNSATLDAPAGEFINWTVVAIDDKDETGDTWEAPQSFELRGPPLAKPDIEKPISTYLKELKWKQPDFASNYSYTLKYLNPQTKKWEQIDTKSGQSENVIKLDTSRPTGRYRLYVQAKAERRKPSPYAQLDFDMRGGYEDEKSVDNAILRESITKPTKFYAIASYLVTKIDYTQKDFDNNASTHFAAVGGTGRVGLGYQPPDNKWGGFGIIDYSGFVIKGQNFKFASMEAHVTRKLEFGQGGLLLFGTGLYSKELPAVKGTPTDGFEGLGKARTMGPHAGFTYWTPISSRFGLQANARAYYSVMGGGPSGEKIHSSLSYQYGLLGSYRLNKVWMGYIGYAYRIDDAQWASKGGMTSYTESGQVNQITIQGHYLNLILDFSF
jgi:hypothetical protein